MQECVVCEQKELRAVGNYEPLRRVTSDCRPWPAHGSLQVCHHCGTVQKLPTESWLGEIKEIYDTYNLFALASGSEQVIFAGDVPQSRSMLLIDFLNANVSLPGTGRLLDIGCGTGAALQNFSRTLPSWKLFGSELSDKNLARLKQIPNFVNLYTSDLSTISERFECITLIHTLEHIIEPLSLIRSVSELLAPGGVLFIQVPDFATSPFDILIADHRTHFTVETLGLLLSRAGMTIDVITNQALPKEISAIARKQGAPTRVDVTSAAEAVSLADRNVQWLHQVRDAGRNLAESGSPLGLFGTSISGMWCYSEMPAGIDFFVDEDRAKLGGAYDGKTIYGPENAPRPSTVFMPLAPTIANRIALRLSGHGPTYVAPPPFP